MTQMHAFVPPGAYACVIGGLLAAACGDAGGEQRLVVSQTAAVTFSANIGSASQLLPDTVDLCWVDDTDKGLVSATDYANEKTRLENLFEAWRVGTRLNFQWRAACRAPQTDSQGRQTYARDEVRIHLDAPPIVPENTPIPGANCTHTYWVTDWASFPDDRKDFCEFNMRLAYGWGNGSNLHEMGHALGLLHEHERADAPPECWIYDAQASYSSTAPGAVPGAIPDNNANGVVMQFDVPAVAAGENPDVTKLRLELDISHPRPADLVVNILPPDSVFFVPMATVHNRTATSVQRVWESWNTAALDPVIGSPVQGTWTVWVRDQVAGSTGSVNSWRLSLNKERRGGGNAIYATAYGDSIMHYGPFGLTSCSAQGNGALTWLLNEDHLAVQMAYPPNDTPVYGEGIYRTDTPVELASGWVVNGAAIGDEFNEGFLSNFSWELTRISDLQTIATSTNVTFAPGTVPAGDYVFFFGVEDFWGRYVQHAGSVKVMTPSEHSAVLASAAVF